MKIGAFAKKYNISIDTVRHYIAEGLLTPIKVNTQFDFSYIDEQVLESILLLKSMNFKLEEMKAYLLFQTVYTQDTVSCLGSFEHQLLEKMKHNKEEIEKLTLMNQNIEKQLKKKRLLHVHRGIPLRMIEEMICPICDVSLELEAPEILHNEILTGMLFCPECEKKYYISYGLLSDEPIDNPSKLNEVKDMMQQYIQSNDEAYVVTIRELCSETYNIVHKNSKNAKNIMMDGQSTALLNRPILRAIPSDCFLLVYSQNNSVNKLLYEDILPKNTIYFLGNKDNIPLKKMMDYIFVQDYDLEANKSTGFKFYPYIKECARMDCLKAFIHNEQAVLANEQDFLKDIENMRWSKICEYKTGRILNKRGSTDMTIVDKSQDLEMQCAIYSFKTLS